MVLKKADLLNRMKESKETISFSSEELKSDGADALFKILGNIKKFTFDQSAEKDTAKLTISGKHSFPDLSADKLKSKLKFVFDEHYTSYNEFSLQVESTEKMNKRMLPKEDIKKYDKMHELGFSSPSILFEVKRGPFDNMEHVVSMTASKKFKIDKREEEYEVTLRPDPDSHSLNMAVQFGTDGVLIDSLNSIAHLPFMGEHTLAAGSVSLPDEFDKAATKRAGERKIRLRYIKGKLDMYKGALSAATFIITIDTDFEFGLGASKVLLREVSFAASLPQKEGDSFGLAFSANAEVGSFKVFARGDVMARRFYGTASKKDALEHRLDAKEFQGLNLPSVERGLEYIELDVDIKNKAYAAYLGINTSWALFKGAELKEIMLEVATYPDGDKRMVTGAVIAAFKIGQVDVSLCARKVEDDWVFGGRAYEIKLADLRGWLSSHHGVELPEIVSHMEIDQASVWYNYTKKSLKMSLDGLLEVSGSYANVQITFDITQEKEAVSTDKVFDGKVYWPYRDRHGESQSVTFNFKAEAGDKEKISATWKQKNPLTLSSFLEMCGVSESQNIMHSVTDGIGITGASMTKTWKPDKAFAITVDGDKWKATVASL
ncbi:hypothetical protein ACIQWR_39705 [Streptomyces sp. NPDC098789]|uniref:hypothetical protein n=1 Tax=Streptomyces sp. NPDC098789 TaxID=3366098 RepID=UPI0037FA4BEF